MRRRRSAVSPLGALAAGLGGAGAAGGLGGGIGGGLGGLLVKGGVVAITAGSLITGAVVHLQGSPHRRAAPQLVANATGGQGAGADALTARSGSTADAVGAREHAPVTRRLHGRAGDGSEGAGRSGSLSARTPAGQRTSAGTSPGVPGIVSPAPSHTVSDAKPPSAQGSPSGGSGEGSPAGPGAGASGSQSPVDSTSGAQGAAGGGSTEPAKPAGGSGGEQSGTSGQGASGSLWFR